MSQGNKDAEEGGPHPGMKSALQPLALATELGVTMGLMTVATVLGGLFLGMWVDRQLGTRPLATLLFILLGVLVGALGTINLAQSALKQLNAAAAQERQVRSAFSAGDLWRALLLVLELVVVTLVPVGLGLWLGLALDRATGAGSGFTLGLGAVGVLAALLGVYLVATRAARRVGRRS